MECQPNIYLKTEGGSPGHHTIRLTNAHQIYNHFMILMAMQFIRQKYE